MRCLTKRLVLGANCDIAFLHARRAKVGTQIICFIGGRKHAINGAG